MDLSSKHEPEPPPATSRTQRLSALTARILSIAALILLFITIFKFAGGVAWEGKTFFNAVRRASCSARVACCSSFELTDSTFASRPLLHFCCSIRSLWAWASLSSSRMACCHGEICRGAAGESLARALPNELTAARARQVD